MSAPSYPDSYYAATAKASEPKPPLKGSVNADVCVIGGGFAGVSAALHLAERGYRVVLLEAMRIGWGASGRNGGQLNSGLRKGPADLIAKFGAEKARRLWDMAEEAKAIVRARVERHGIDCDLKSGNILAAHKPEHLPDMAEQARLLAEVFDYPKVRIVAREELREMLDSPLYYGGLLDSGAGHLHPLNYVLGLAGAAEEAGATLHEGTPVTAIEETASKASVTTPDGTVEAEYVVVCCNAYLGRLVPALAAKIMPIRNHVIATEPLGEARAHGLIRDDAAVCDTKFVVDYYRLSADKRLIFGGGETYAKHPPRDMAAFVRPYMLKVFPQLADVRIDYAWDGQVGITLSRLPHFGREGRMFYTHGFSGQGVALTSLAGLLVAEAMAGTAERFDVFASIPHSDFPGGTWLRRPAQVLGMLFYALRDRL
jgi:gamma-glutamylputrescine oxidase